MNKTLKISYGLIFVLAILLAFIFTGLPVAAASEGSLTIRKFDVNRYENLKDSTGQISDQTDLPADAIAMADVEFKVEKLLVEVGDKNVTTTNPVDTSFTARKEKTNTSGEAVFNDLPKGYYLVTETVPTGYDAPDEGKFVVAIPMQVVDENGITTLNYDVVVYPKNQKIQVEKVLNDTKKVVGIGDIVSWTIDYPLFAGLKKEEIDSSGNATIHYGKNFYITDEMDSRLDYVDGSVQMKYLNATGNDTGLTLSEGVDYHITYNPSTHILRIDFTDNIGTKKVVDAGVTNIEMTIKTAVNASALETIIPMYNNARISFTNVSGDPFEHEVFPPGTNPEDGRVPKVYLGSIEITKVDSEDESQVLKGATFTLKQGDETITVTTDDKGRATISAIGAGKYQLEEIQAPEGYKKITTPIEVEVVNDIDKRITKLTISNVKADETTDPKVTPTATPVDDGKDGPKDGDKSSTSGGASSSGKSAPSSNAKTGDTAQLLGIALLAIASLGIIIVVFKKRRVNSR